MSKITQDSFVRAVAKYFEPLANEYGLSVVPRTQSLFEICTVHFVMRIRFDVGAHTKSMNATLIPTDQLPGDSERGGKGELGIGLIAAYNGVNVGYIPRDATEDGFFDQAKYVADMVRKYAFPYLLGQKTDWNSVNEFLVKKNEQSKDRIQKYKFPPNVQKRWR